MRSDWCKLRALKVQVGGQKEHGNEGPRKDLSIYASIEDMALNRREWQKKRICVTDPN